jgi:hypothetical protein
MIMSMFSRLSRRGDASQGHERAHWQEELQDSSALHLGPCLSGSPMSFSGYGRMGGAQKADSCAGN